MNQQHDSVSVDPWIQVQQQTPWVKLIRRVAGVRQLFFQRNVTMEYFFLCAHQLITFWGLFWSIVVRGWTDGYTNMPRRRHTPVSSSAYFHPPIVVHFYWNRFRHHTVCTRRLSVHHATVSDHLAEYFDTWGVINFDCGKVRVPAHDKRNCPSSRGWGTTSSSATEEAPMGQKESRNVTPVVALRR
jgi:hypothetical protein